MNPLAGLTYRRAALIVATVVLGLYANALLNRFAGDDVLIILQNDRVHSAGAAWRSWFSGYWPPPWESAGLYRPLTILGYGIEWSVSGGRPWLFHLDNVLLHALASVLVVGVAAAWLPPLGALYAGLLFVVHPVHVEAVSNVVGRAELLAAAALLGIILGARHHRHSERGPSADRWLALTLACLAAGLLSKEHAVIGIVLVAMDQVLDPQPARRSCWDLYLGLAAVTIAWLFLWRAIAGGNVITGANTAFYGLTDSQRIATMMAVQLDLIRLLVFPLDITSDYSQMTTELRFSWGWVPWAGLIAAGSIGLLGVTLVRRAPPIAFGILVAAASYAPISNLFFISGVVLAERALYLAVLAPALALGWAVSISRRRPERRVLSAAVLVFLAVMAARTFTRTPYWQSATHTILEDAIDHPENYRGRIHLAGMFRSARDTVRALAEYLAAGALAENDPFVGQFTVGQALAQGRAKLAVLEGRRVHDIAPDDPRTGRWLIEAYAAAGQHDSAIAVALRDARRRPRAVGLIRTYRQALVSADAPAWRVLLAGAADDWLSGRLIRGTARLDSASVMVARAAPRPWFCDDLAIAGSAMRALRPVLVERVRAAAARAGKSCEALN